MLKIIYLIILCAVCLYGGYWIGNKPYKVLKASIEQREKVIRNIITFLNETIKKREYKNATIWLGHLNSLKWQIRETPDNAYTPFVMMNKPHRKPRKVKGEGGE